MVLGVMRIEREEGPSRLRSRWDAIGCMWWIEFPRHLGRAVCVHACREGLSHPSILRLERTVDMGSDVGVLLKELIMVCACRAKRGQ